MLKLACFTINSLMFSDTQSKIGYKVTKAFLVINACLLLFLNFICEGKTF